MNNELDLDGRGISCFNGDTHLLYWADHHNEIAFLVPSLAAPSEVRVFVYFSENSIFFSNMNNQHPKYSLFSNGHGRIGRVAFNFELGPKNWGTDCLRLEDLGNLARRIVFIF